MYFASTSSMVVWEQKVYTTHCSLDSLRHKGGWNVSWRLVRIIRWHRNQWPDCSKIHGLSSATLDYERKMTNVGGVRPHVLELLKRWPLTVPTAVKWDTSWASVQDVVKLFHIIFEYTSVMVCFSIHQRKTPTHRSHSLFRSFLAMMVIA